MKNAGARNKLAMQTSILLASIFPGKIWSSYPETGTEKPNLTFGQ